MRVVQGSLKGGEHVVVDGLQRIQPGMPVAPQVLKVDARGMPIFPTPGGAPGAPGQADATPPAKS
jgi:multidrug efflux system membrane fusion protein